MHTTRRTRSFLAGALMAGVVAALTACSPPADSPIVASPPAAEAPSPSTTPSEAPHAPTVDALVITPNGMGTLTIDIAPSTDPELQMVEEDPAACSDERTGFGAGVAVGDPAALRWVPIAAYLVPDGFPHWSVDVAASGVLTRIDLHDNTVPTDAGVRIGDSREAALAAYPGATIVPEGLTDLLVIPGEHGVLHIEIARDPGGDLAGYWEGQVNQVVYIRAVELSSGAFTVAASENIAGGCL